MKPTSLANSEMRVKGELIMLSREGGGRQTRACVGGPHADTHASMRECKIDHPIPHSQHNSKTIRQHIIMIIIIIIMNSNIAFVVRIVVTKITKLAMSVSYLFQMFVDPLRESFLLYGISLICAVAAARAGTAEVR